MDNENEKDLEQTNGQPEGLNVEGLDMTDHDKIIPVKIDEEMRKSYIDYSMSVIVSRALPSVTLWVNITRTVTVVSTERWCVWHSRGICATAS